MCHISLQGSIVPRELGSVNENPTESAWNVLPVSVPTMNYQLVPTGVTLYAFPGCD